MHARFWLIACFAGSSLLSIPAAAEGAACQTIASRFSETGRNAAMRTVNSFLFEAAGADCPMLVEGLLKEGGSVRVRGREGDSVLHHAARAGADDVVTQLIQRGAIVDLRDLAGGTALFYAVQADRFKTVQLLLERGSDPNIEGRAGVTPLEAAAGELLIFFSNRAPIRATSTGQARTLSSMRLPAASPISPNA